MRKSEEIHANRTIPRRYFANIYTYWWAFLCVYCFCGMSNDGWCQWRPILEHSKTFTQTFTLTFVLTPFSWFLWRGQSIRTTRNIPILYWESGIFSQLLGPCSYLLVIIIIDGPTFIVLPHASLWILVWPMSGDNWYHWRSCYLILYYLSNPFYYSFMSESLAVKTFEINY